MSSDSPEAHLPAIAKLTHRVELRAVYSRSLASAQSLADTAKDVLNTSTAPAVYHDDDASANLDALLARPDISAVLVVLPITTQPDVILKSLAAGKHVLSEKPIEKNVQQSIALINQFESKYKPQGLIWKVAENYEAEPGYRAAAHAIREGKIGKVSFFKLQAVNYIDKTSKWYQTPWRTVPDVSSVFIAIRITEFTPQIIRLYSIRVVS